MKTLYDVQQFLKNFGIIIYMGKRLYDIEMMKIELERLRYCHNDGRSLSYLEALRGGSAQRTSSKLKLFRR